jgi:Ca2+-binding RTX toxin-like protein
LEGNFLDNRLLGWGGDDVLAGGSGSDELVGGVGADWFLLDALGRGVDKLLDFSVLEGDKIGVKLTEGMRASLRGGLVQEGADGLGEMVAGVVVSGVGVKVAQEWDDRWLYDSESGELRWDVDGVGGVGSELVAVLGVVGQRPQQLSSEDFVLFS